jgi:hypothetical protein
VPHFSVRTPEGSRLKVLAAVFAIGVPFLAGRDGKASPLESLSLAEVGLTEQVSVDRLSGVAIGGYDPVAYFVVGSAVAGSPSYEAIWNGAAWRFANEGNRAAFLADPKVYAPAFGGYDAAGIASGVAVPADPTVFAIVDGRLLLFKDPDGRRSFLASPDGARAAEAAWPSVEHRLIR